VLDAVQDAVEAEDELVVRSVMLLTGPPGQGRPVWAGRWR
jgi:hypothetical protein